MSVQLREPCTRSLQHFLKPWPVLIHRPRKNLTSLPLQGTTHSFTPPFKWPFIISPSTRSYTATAALRSITKDVIDPAVVESSLSKTQPSPTCKLKNKKPNAWKLWTQYQATFSTSKETLDFKQYDILMTALVEKALTSNKPGFWARIIQAYEESRTLDLYPSPTMYTAAIKAYGRNRDIIKVTAIFKEYKKRYIPTATFHQHYLTALIDYGDLHAAHHIFYDLYTSKSISKSQASSCLAALVPVCVKRNNIGLALKATEGLPYRLSDWNKDALETVTKSLWNGYSTLLSLPPSTNITPLSVESFVSMYIEKATTSKAFIPSHLFTMFNLICHNNIVPTATTCNLVLNIQSRHFGRVKSILSTMRKLDIEPTSETVSILLDTFGAGYDFEGDDIYNAFINALTTTQQPQDTQSMMKEFMKRGELETKAMDWLTKAHCTDLDCYAMVMEAWIHRGQWDRCIVEYERLKIDFPHIDKSRRSVKALLTASLARGQDWDQCEKLLDRTKINFTEKTILCILSTMLNSERQSGAPMVQGQSIVKSLQLMERTWDIQLTADGIGKVISSLGKRGDIQDGFRLYNWVRGLDDNERCSSSSIYRAMMSSATRNNDLRILERAWTDMQYRKRFLDGCENDPKETHSLITYNILLNGYASRLPRPDVTRVKWTFQRILEHNLSPCLDTYNILIKTFVNANNMEAADQTFRKIIESGLKPDTYTANTILNGWIIRRDWPQVENFVRELMESACKDDNEHCTKTNLGIITFNLIVQSFLQLDSKTMNYTHFLKEQNRWSHIEQVQDSNRDKGNEMPIKKIWNIFESTTGFDRKSLTLLQKNQQPNENAFVKLFSTKEADEVTYKLFMKAFVNIGAYKSAYKVYHWMKFRLEVS